jgi:hypothetical protein
MNPVDFFIVGSAKCGTTFLSSVLDGHPEIAISSPKEPRYFSDNFARGTSWYHSLFEDGADVLLKGEGSVNYSQCDLEDMVYERIRDYNPDAKILLSGQKPNSEDRFTFQGAAQRRARYAVRCGESTRQVSKHGGKYAL